MKRTSYHVSMVFNGLEISEIVIDQHYRLNHQEMTDDLILKLVSILQFLNLEASKTCGNFSYYVHEPIYWMRKPYRLIVVLENGCNYLGVVNAFRVQEKNKWDSLQKKN